MDETPFKGLFTNAGNKTLQPETESETYRMTAKYNDPFSADADRKMAKFLVTDLPFRNLLTGLPGAKDPLLQRLITDRGYFDFFLQLVDEGFDEKFQIVEMLSDSYAVFGIGKKPRILNCSGVLLNCVENDWRLNFIKLFEKYLSVSSLAKLRKAGVKNQVTMMYDSVTVTGAVLGLRTSMRAENEMVAPFSFTMLVNESVSFNINQLASLAIQAQVTEPAATGLVSKDTGSISSKGDSAPATAPPAATAPKTTSDNATINRSSFDALYGVSKDKLVTQNENAGIAEPVA